MIPWLHSNFSEWQWCESVGLPYHQESQKELLTIIQVNVTREGEDTKQETDKESKGKVNLDAISNLNRTKLKVETSIEPLKTSLIKEAIASGIGRNKICDHATKAAAYLKDMLEKEKPLK